MTKLYVLFNVVLCFLDIFVPQQIGEKPAETLTLNHSPSAETLK